MSTREAVLRAQERRLRREAAARWRRLALLAAGVLAADQVAKAVVRSRLADGESHDIFPGFAISRVTNEGIAFGLFPGKPGAIALLTVIALLAFGAAVIGSARRHPWVPIGGGLLFGGSVSNLVDRVAGSGVTDYLDPAHWPAFNIADIGIVVGACMIAYGLTRPDPAEPDGG